ncbi:DUF402 domain-containing protein [Nocardioides astragali]|uniref:DUF402 domain-containing protein n=1 Tax=Nocardioides astragali TaxID=1776736 RepID=A0ABW2N327_9ACTN|nr:DUF402 domain-containing protein [Nocardioides astragali]
MEPGTPIRCEMTKWGDRPHWQFEGIHLGSDENGEWIGVPAGRRYHRPGHEFHSEVDTVTVVPAGGWYAATFHAPGTWCHTYVDITTEGVWDGHVLRMVDLDLDVVRLADPLPDFALEGAREAGRTPGEIYVDDEDEFAEHQVAFGYPAEIIEAAQDSCDAVLAAVRASAAPYDGTHLRWLAELSRMSESLA